jgi:hypothetical protein
MKFNKWTVALAAVGVVSLASAARADEHLSQVQTALSNTTISGYVDVSAQWNLGSQNGTDTRYPSYAHGAWQKADGFNLNGVDIALDKPMDESQWASGYRVELMIGPDSPTSSSSYSGAALRQAYLALRTPVGNGINWKFGVFDSPLGYESTSDPLNPNYTRSYGYTIEPTTLTGVLATYKVNDVVTVQAGMADTWSGYDGRAARESEKTYLATIGLTAPDSWGWIKGATLNFGVEDALGSYGDHYNDGVRGATSWYIGATLPTPITKLKLGAAFDYYDDHNSEGHWNPSDDSIWVMGLYATYQATDKLSLNLRAEYLSEDGVNISGFTEGTDHYLWNNAAEEITATVQYQLWANVLSRVELRWDHVEHGTAFDDRVQNDWHLSPAHDNAYMLAVNLIYQF